MSCPWADKEAYRYVERELGTAEREMFESHLIECETCRCALDEARHLDELLRETLTPVEPPIGITARVMQRAMEQVVIPSSQSRWRLKLPTLRFRSLVTAAIALILMIGVVTLYSPANLVAQIQSLFYFIPGIGIRAVDENTLVAQGLVTVREGNLSFTVQALLSDGKTTAVNFTVTGLPGGKENLSKEKPARIGDADASQQPSDPGSARMPFLRDPIGREYKAVGSWQGTGGSPKENVMSGGMSFPTLPTDLKEVDLYVPIRMLMPQAPPAPEFIIAKIPLTHPEASTSMPARALDAYVTSNGITLKAVSMVQTGEMLVINVEATTTGGDKVMGFGSQAGPTMVPAILLDANARQYQSELPGSELVPNPYSADLRFKGTASAHEPLILVVDSIRVAEQGSGRLVIPIKGKQIGDIIKLNREVQVGDYQVFASSAQIIGSSNETWLRVEVDLGQRKNDRKLIGVVANNPRATGSSQFFEQGEGSVSAVGVPIDLAKDEIEVSLESPMALVQGPWRLDLQ